MSENTTTGKDVWDKVEILSKPVGALITAVIVAYLGLLVSNILESRQASQSRMQLYSQLMTSREQSDSELRKEMFNTSLNNFLTPQNAEDKIVKLELLAHNFHGSLDLAPLFNHLYDFNESALTDVNKKIRKLARVINDKQLSILSSVGESLEGSAVPIEKIVPEGVAVIGDPKERIAPILRIDEGGARAFLVEILRSKEKLTKLRLRLRSGRIAETAILDGNEKYIERKYTEFDFDETLEIGIFDFPMMRNIHLPGGSRVSIVVRRLEDVAEVVLIYFPASRSALKEKPYYDEIIDELLRE